MIAGFFFSCHRPTFAIFMLNKMEEPKFLRLFVSNSYGLRTHATLSPVAGNTKYVDEITACMPPATLTSRSSYFVFFAWSTLYQRKKSLHLIAELNGRQRD